MGLRLVCERGVEYLFSYCSVKGSINASLAPGDSAAVYSLSRVSLPCRRVLLGIVGFLLPPLFRTGNPRGYSTSWVSFLKPFLAQKSELFTDCYSEHSSIAYSYAQAKIDCRTFIQISNVPFVPR